MLDGYAENFNSVYIQSEQYCNFDYSTDIAVSKVSNN